MAAIGVALWRYIMRYAPHTPDFFNRDRFVLSNGHTCLFQYTFLHLTGYKAMTFDQLKSYHSERVDALCPGHPEIEHEGVEVTTGPLGQGVANAVGLAMASKNLAATYNRPGYDVVNNHTWCMIGDACLQEGVALEAISLAGHWKLNNLTIMYDNNQITCDGSVDLTNTEDINAKMRACGWDVIDVEDGCYDVEGIVQALQKARASTDKPTFINVRTVIGLDSKVEGQAAAHGAAFGVSDVAEMKRKYGFNPEEHFVISDTVREFFADIPARGEGFVKEWDDLVKKYSEAHPELAAEFQRRVRGELPSDWQEKIPTDFPDKPTASRASSGLVFNPLAQDINNFMVGTADLSPSVNMIWKGKVDFQHVSPPILFLTPKLTSTARPPHNLRYQRRLLRPVHPLRCSRARHGRYLQRPRSLLPKHLHPHHLLLLHVLPIRRSRRTHGRSAAPPSNPRGHTRLNRHGRRWTHAPTHRTRRALPRNAKPAIHPPRRQ
jgi:dihydroxyacetone synthase